MNQEIINILFNFLPEITLALTIIVLNISTGFKSNKSNSGYYIFISGIAFSFILTMIQAYYAPQMLFNGTFAADHFSYGARLIITGTMLMMGLILYEKNMSNDYGLITASAIGALLSVSAANIFVLFVTLQVMVIPLYLLIYYNIKPAIKYFIFSSISMAVMLYGFTLLYGITGSGSMIEISRFLSFKPFNNQVLIIAVVLITYGFAFLSFAAPINLSFPLLAGKIRITHLAQFAAINTITILFVIARFFSVTFHDYNSFITDAAHYNLIAGVNWQLMLAVISCVTIIAGNFVLLWQYDLKKIFSYITIAQVGYILMGIVSGSHDGLTTVIFNIAILAINSLGLLYCISIINREFTVTDIEGIKGLGRKNKFLFTAFIFFLISSAGFPLSGGFTGKIMLYISLGTTKYIWLIAAGVLSSAVFLYFNFRLGVSIFSGKKDVKTSKIETKSLIILLFLMINGLVSGLYIEPLLNWVKYVSNIFGI